MAKSFRVVVNDEEYEFLKKLAKYDGVTLHQEVQQLLSLQIWEEMQIEHDFDNKSDLEMLNTETPIEIKISCN